MPSTDLELWDEIAVTEQPTWENRASIFSHFIRPRDRVMDLGAGNQKLRKYIPSNCDYVPVDCTDKLDNTFVVDFNNEFKLPDGKFDVIVSLGFVEYMVDLDDFMEKLSTHSEGTYFLFTYSYFKDKVGKGKFNKLNKLRSFDEVQDKFSKYCEDLRPILHLKNSALFSGSLTSKRSNKPTPTQSLNDSLPLPKIQDYLFKRR
nr:methyltransferase domain-containing protein [uncultured Cohaesibacter sp.]